MQPEWYGIHRVLEPKGVLPQPAWKLDAIKPITDEELLIDVERINIDSASFQQLFQQADGDKEQIEKIIFDIIASRGKMHNPVTGSGGMLIGTVVERGSAFPSSVPIGTKIATLVSLTLTPLQVKEIHQIDLATGQVELDARAILFASSPFAVLPPDIPEAIALAVLDVCGAPAQMARSVQTDDIVLVIGAGGKSGLLSSYQAKKQLGRNGKLIALESSEEASQKLASFGWFDHVLQLDARNPIALLEEVKRCTDGKLSSLTFNCVPVPDTEASSILATRDGGIVYFFSMSTQFSVAALTAEGLGKDVTMMIGNGYVPGHAELALRSLRESPDLYQWFAEKYGIEE